MFNRISSRFSWEHGANSNRNLIWLKRTSERVSEWASGCCSTRTHSSFRGKQNNFIETWLSKAPHKLTFHNVESDGLHPTQIKSIFHAYFWKIRMKMNILGMDDTCNFWRDRNADFWRLKTNKRFSGVICFIVKFILFLKGGKKTCIKSTCSGRHHQWNSRELLHLFGKVQMKAGAFF